MRIDGRGEGSESGALEPPVIDRLFPLDGAKAAYEALLRNGHSPSDKQPQPMHDFRLAFRLDSVSILSAATAQVPGRT